ncbi:MAG: FtsH protease activity modulator HflK [Gammaproteobacteria bacterium]|nr:FtsH protease activity modulator HflK [Gammaproteobacteria bacterium]
MPWNTPGNNNDDPWNRKSNNQGPPDLDEVFQKLGRKFGGLFGGSGGGSNSSSGSPNGSSSIGLIAIFIVAIVWAMSGIYKVTEGEAGVILQFGKYKETTNPGLHWHVPFPVQSLFIVDTQQVRSARHQTTMLTQDENIVEIILAAQYRVKDAPGYLFNLRGPETTLKQAMESAIREIVGKSKVDFVLYEGLEVISSSTKELMQEILDRYDSGIEITSLNLEKTQPPSPVQNAFDDVIKSREDLERYIQEAEAYANTIVPQARGEAARITEEATGYKEAIVATAEGESERFSALLTEYRKAPSITRERLYLEATEAVFSNSTKIMLDVEGGNNLMYLPLDKLIQNATPTRSNNTGAANTSSSFGSSRSSETPQRPTRGRENR